MKTDSRGKRVFALALSGLDTGRFVFDGFLSTSRKSRFEHLAALKNEPRTIVLYEAPHKLRRTLDDLFEALGERQIALCREMTKLHEEVLRTTLGQGLERYRREPPRGEFVLVVEGSPAPEKAAATLEDGLERVSQLLEAGLSRKDAVKQAAKELDLSRNELYTAALER